MNSSAGSMPSRSRPPWSDQPEPGEAVADLQRLHFLRTLIRSGQALTIWEQQFVACFRHSSRPSLWFTRRRRLATDRLRQKYDSARPVAL